LEQCKFVYDGNWGDDALVKHEHFHDIHSDPSSHWLGFDAPQVFGQYSNRDGKRE